jgi:hypothetical protein
VTSRARDALTTLDMLIDERLDPIENYGITNEAEFRAGVPASQVIFFVNYATHHRQVIIDRVLPHELLSITAVLVHHLASRRVSERGKARATAC